MRTTDKVGRSHASASESAEELVAELVAALAELHRDHRRARHPGRPLVCPWRPFWVEKRQPRQAGRAFPQPQLRGGYLNQDYDSSVSSNLIESHSISILCDTSKLDSRLPYFDTF